MINETRTNPFLENKTVSETQFSLSLLRLLIIMLLKPGFSYLILFIYHENTSLFTNNSTAMRGVHSLGNIS